jgi:hypothetical protein
MEKNTFSDYIIDEKVIMKSQLHGATSYLVVNNRRVIGKFLTSYRTEWVFLFNVNDSIPLLGPNPTHLNPLYR